MHAREGDALSRRRFLQAGALAAGAAWAPAMPGPAAAGPRVLDPAPAGFPPAIPLRRRQFENWAGAIRVRGLWTCAPRNAAEVVAVVNWAHGAGWTVRPRGAMHGWSPFTVTADSDRRTQTMLVDTRALNGLALVARDPAAVRAGAGATMLSLLAFLEARGLGLRNVPATGDPTVGGALAIGGHGATLPADGEPEAAGDTFGSLSNLVLGFTAIVWDGTSGRYVLREISRADPDAKAFLVHLGRAFLTDVTLRAGSLRSVRCVSRIDIGADELFAPPGAAGRTFESFVADAGGVEAIWFSFTDKPWLKVWSVEPARPPTSRAVTQPYNYPFSDTIPEPLAELSAALVKGFDRVTPQFGETEYRVVDAGLRATQSEDLWGPAKNTHLYIRASTLRVDESGYAILTRRADVQRVIHLFANAYRELAEAYRRRGSFPMNGPVELRCCGIDRPQDAGVAGAESPALAATAPRPDRPDWDTVVWLNLLTFPGTDDSYRFYRAMERWTLATFDGTWAAARPEWSKGWAFSDTAAWADADLLDEGIAQLVSAGRGADEDWAWAMGRLDAHDPHRVFSNGFLDRFARAT